MTLMKKILLGYILFFVFITQVMPRIFALSSGTENVTVVLKGCESKECYMKGTLTKNPVTLDFILTNDNGLETLFSSEDVVMIAMATPIKPLESVK